MGVRTEGVDVNPCAGCCVEGYAPSNSSGPSVLAEPMSYRRIRDQSFLRLTSVHRFMISLLGPWGLGKHLFTLRLFTHSQEKR